MLLLLPPFSSAHITKAPLAHGWLIAGPQYQSYHLLLAEVSSFSARLPYSGYRPRLRPAGG